MSNSVKYILIYRLVYVIMLNTGNVSKYILKCYFWLRGMNYAGGKDDYGVTYAAAVY